MPRGLELLIAQTILQGFDAQYGRFLEVTSGAQQRFEQADWHAVQQAMKNRIHLYDHHVGLVVEQLRCITNGQSTDAAFLLRVKEHYTRLLPDYPRFEIAESFFNSVYCRLFDHRSLTPERLFIFSSQPERRFRTIPRPLAKDFHPDHGWESLLMRVISDLPLRLRWQNKSRDIHYIIRHLTETLGTDNLAESHLQVANELFYRNKAAWLVGKLITPSGTLPFLLPIHQTDDGELFIDTCLTTTAEASIVFGFARSYFMVYVGGTFGVGSDKVETEGTEVKNTTFKILPEVGYELNEDWSVGTVVGYEYNKSGDVKTNTFTIVPYARYFFLSSNVVRLFADGGFGFSTSKTKGNDALNSWNIGIKPGIAIKLSDHFCLVAKYGFLGYSKKENHGYESENVGIDFDTDELNFGFHYIF